MPEKPQLSGRETLVKHGFRRKVNNEISKNLPNGKALTENKTFQNGLDNFAHKFAKQPNAAQEPGKAIGGVLIQDALKGYMDLRKSIGDGAQKLANGAIDALY